ncbi:MAG: ACT domain-containing protein [Firmicutes bacterium]|nr:ACT domain-containing protein [Bacillota bacterium]
MRIAVLGPKGTYSEKAARAYAARLGNNEPELIYTTIEKSLHMVQSRMADTGVVPLENLVDGIIGATLDALIEYQDFVKVADEVNIPIRHTLAAAAPLPAGSIKVVYSHASALNQCSRRLGELAPQAELVPVASTAEAAALVRRNGDSRSAAVCSVEAVRENTLVVISREIDDYPNNLTRFVACSLTDSPASGDDRTLMAVRFGQDRPGLLHWVTGELAKRDVNLTFVQSRPYKYAPREYILVFEMVGHKTDPHVEETLRSIDKRVLENFGWKKILGSFPKRGAEPGESR